MDFKIYTGKEIGKDLKKSRNSIRKENRNSRKATGRELKGVFKTKRK
jgi:hypothetical protein